LIRGSFQHCSATILASVLPGGSRVEGGKLKCNPPAPPLLDEKQAAFTQRRVSILVGSCSNQGVPSLARA